MRATKRILEAQQNITPRLVERCLSPCSFSAPTGKALVTAHSVAFRDCAGAFNIYCAAPGIADQYTPSLQILPCQHSISKAEAEELAEQLIASLKDQYRFTRMRLSPNRSRGYILYWSSQHFDRSAMYWFKFAKRDTTRRSFGGIMIANMHRRR